MANRLPKRVLLILPAGVSLIAALDAGLVRIGWPLPLPAEELPLAHGPLMVSAFLGTLIGLEKAVAVGKRWAFAGPFATGIGGIGLIAATESAVPRALLFGGSFGLVAATCLFYMRQRTTANLLVLGGACSWALGNGLWLWRWPLFTVVPSWMGFLLLTIAGERLELNRLLRPSLLSRAAFVSSALLALAGITTAALGFLVDVDATVLFTPQGDRFSSPVYDAGVRVLGGGLLAVGLWLLANDMARLSLRRPGLPRFMAVSLLAGYVWLGVSGTLFLAQGSVVSGVRYDALLHAFFLGFVFSMIFAHGPVIFPAILERRLDFHLGFYLPVVLLHAGLFVRLWGDFAEQTSARPWGGLANAIAILLFLGITVWRLRLQRWSQP
jgi:hypothetical protein